MAWKKFLIYYARYLLLGSGLLLILFTFLNTGFKGIFERGPQPISAQEADPSDSYFIPDTVPETIQDMPTEPVPIQTEQSDNYFSPEMEPITEPQPAADTYFTPETEPVLYDDRASDTYFVPETEQLPDQMSDTYFAPEGVESFQSEVSDSYFAPDTSPQDYEAPSDTYFAPEIEYENPSDTYFSPEVPEYSRAEEQGLNPPVYSKPSERGIFYPSPQPVIYSHPSIAPYPSNSPPIRQNIYNRQPQNITINNNPRSSSTSRSSSRSVVNLSLPQPSPQISPLSFNCRVTPSMVVVGDQVTWSSSVIGGSGNLSYDWFGNNLIENQNASTFTVIYQSPGIRSGSLTITDNRTGISKTQNCGSVNVLPLSKSTPVSIVRQESADSVMMVNTQNQIACPPGTIFSHASSDTIYCSPDTSDINIQQSAVQTVTAQQPVSASSPYAQTSVQTQTAPKQVEITQSEPSYVKELPKTGLPLLGLSAGLLIPLGIKLNKLGTFNKLNSSIANSVWVDKQLKS